MINNEQAMYYLNNLIEMLETHLDYTHNDAPIQALDLAISALKTIEDGYKHAKLHSAQPYDISIMEEARTRETLHKQLESIAHYDCGYDDCKECICSSPFGCIKAKIEAHINLIKGEIKYALSESPSQVDRQVAYDISRIVDVLKENDEEGE